MIAPTTALTPDGPTVVLGGRQDYWTYNSEGYLARVHKVPRKALFQPERTCPVPTAQLEDFRRTIVRREDEKTATMRTSGTTTSPSTSVSNDVSSRDNPGQVRPGSRSSLEQPQ